MSHIALPAYDPSNTLHVTISTSSQNAHRLSELGKADEKELREVEEQLDRNAAELWKLTDEELSNMQAYLR